ncbi:MAG: hypothetical protein QOI89_2489 [Solirubrobacteraceae bacterium]|jgi:hypothetical protein|nr:hypothetical protein [Solirubrobacteraceae bacterium]
MPSTPRTWAEGEKGTAADLNKIEIALKWASVMINFKEAPFNVKGEGDEGVKMNEALSLAGIGGEEWVVWVPLGTYSTSISLKVPAEVRIMGANEHNCRFIAKGNIDLFQLTEGNNRVENIYVEAETKQTSGSAFDLSHGAVDDIHFCQVKLGHNFFNGFYCVGATGELGGLHFREIHFKAWNGAVKNYSGAAFVFGSSTRRVAGVWLNDIHGQANTTADMPRWFEINNVDSCLGTNVGLQFGGEGVCVGNSDTSALKTTGLHLTNIWCDSMSLLGYKVEKARDTVFTDANAQNCGDGAFIGPEAIQTRWISPTIQANKRHGIRWGPTSLGGSINGGVITDNNSNAEAIGAGVLIEAGASKVKIVGVDIGNMMFYAEKQTHGVLIEKGKSKNILVTANRIPEKGTGTGENKTKAIVNEAEGTEAENKVEIKNNLLA